MKTLILKHDYFSIPKYDYFSIPKFCKLLLLSFILAYSYTPTIACGGGNPSGTLTGPASFCQLGVTGSSSFYTITATNWSETVFTVSGGTIASCTGTLTPGASAQCFDDNDIGWYLGQFISPGTDGPITVEVIWTTSGSRSVNLNVFRNGFTNSEINIPINYNAPPQNITISGASGLICTNTTSVNLSASGGSGGYTWTSTSSSGIPLSHPNTGTFVTFTNFTPNTFYSINAASTGSCGQPITGSVSLITGQSCRPSAPGSTPSADQAPSVHILNKELSAKTKLFPNPISQQDFVNLSIPDELHDAEIVLFNQNGQLIHSARATKGAMRLEIGNLESGNYIVMIRNEKANIAKQLIVGSANGATSID